MKTVQMWSVKFFFIPLKQFEAWFQPTKTRVSCVCAVRKQVRMTKACNTSMYQSYLNLYSITFEDLAAWAMICIKKYIDDILLERSILNFFLWLRLSHEGPKNGGKNYLNTENTNLKFKTCITVLKIVYSIVFLHVQKFMVMLTLKLGYG